MTPWLATAWVTIGTLLLSTLLYETANGRGLAKEGHRGRFWFFSTSMMAIVAWPLVVIWITAKSLYVSIVK